MSLRNFTAKPTLTALAAANGTLTAGATTAILDSVANLPTAPFTAVWERGSATNEEVVLVTAVNTGTATVTMTRGYDGTTAVSHNTGATFEHCTSAIDFSEANAHVNATTNVHGTTGSLVDTGSTQTVGGVKTFTGLVTTAGGLAALGAATVGGAAAADLTLQNTTVTTGVGQSNIPGGLRWSGHTWNGAGPNDMAVTASIVPTLVGSGITQGLKLTYQSGTVTSGQPGHQFSGGPVTIDQLLTASNGIQTPRGNSINLDGGTSNTTIQAESSAGASFTGSGVSDLIIKEPNGQSILIGTHGASGVQNPTLMITSTDVLHNDNGTMRSAPRGYIGGFSNVTNATPPTNASTGSFALVTGMADTGAITLVASRRYKFTVTLTWDSSVANGGITAAVVDGGASAPTTGSTIIGGTHGAYTSVISNNSNLSFSFETTALSAGTHRFGIVFRARGSGTATATNTAANGEPSYMLIEDIGT